MTEKTNHPGLSIVLPVYNEEMAIKDVVGRLKDVTGKISLPTEIIVVDDASTDSSPRLLAGIKGIKVITHDRNFGEGAARKTGTRAAQYDLVATTDADGTYPEEPLIEMVKYFPQYDMVVGARKKEAGSLKPLRWLVKEFIRRLASYVSGYDIPDLNSGLRMYKRDEALKFFRILPDGHSLVSTITLAFFCNGYRVKYLDIEYYSRTGRSSFHPIKDTYAYLLLVVRTIMYFQPLKIFMPVSLAVFLGGTARTLYDAWYLHRIKESDIMFFLAGILIGILGLLADLIVRTTKWD